MCGESHSGTSAIKLKLMIVMVLTEQLSWFAIIDFNPCSDDQSVSGDLR
jgi:hypothetical protein